jgi:hypothetical protein
MPNFIEKHQTKQTLSISPEKKRDFEAYLSNEIDDSRASHKFLEDNWRACHLRYEGVPKLESRDVPIENAPNIEITIGAIASDTIYAQAIDLIFGVTPLVTVRPKPKFANDSELVNDSKALQVFVNHLGSSPEVDLRNAAEDALLDDVQLGTGVLYIPWVTKTKKTKTAKILAQGPRIRAAAIEDVIVPGGTRQCIDEMPFFGVVFHYTEQQLKSIARTNNWDISAFAPLGARNWVRSRREILANQTEGVETKGKLYEVIMIY